MLCSTGGQKSQIRFTGLVQVPEGRIPLTVLQGESTYLPLAASLAACIPWLMAPSSIFKANNGGLGSSYITNPPSGSLLSLLSPY